MIGRHVAALVAVSFRTARADVIRPPFFPQGAFMKHTIRLLIAALTLTACADAAAPPKPVDIGVASVKAGASRGATTLPTFGGPYAVAHAINDAGMVVGIAYGPNQSRDVPGTGYAAKWVRNAAGGWVVAKLELAAVSGGRALALNELGDAVGIRVVVTPGEVTVQNAIAWPAGGDEVSLGSGVAQGINSAGFIVGSDRWGGGSSAFVWTPDAGSSPSTWTRRDLPLLEAGGLAGALAINEGGVIAGAATRAGLWRAVIWLPIEGGWSAPIPRDGTDASTGTSAGFGINDQGDVVGYSRSCPPQTCAGHPYVWPAEGGSVDLAELNSSASYGRATGIADRGLVNDDGRVVGYTGVTRGNGGGPFVWMPGDATLTDLGTGEANDINNRTASYGQEAVGVSSSSRGQSAMVWRIP